VDDLELALALADEADAISMARFQSNDLIVETKPDMTPVSDADRAVERSLRDILALHRPSDAVHGEEYGSVEGSRQWIIDPIDGTKGFVRGVPVWATLIGLREGDEITTGVVSAPALGRRWWARVDTGAYCSSPGRQAPRGPLSVSAVGESPTRRSPSPMPSAGIEAPSIGYWAPPGGNVGTAISGPM